MLLCKKESSCDWNAGNVLDVTTPVGKEFHSVIVLGKKETIDISISSRIGMDVVI